MSYSVAYPCHCSFLIARLCLTNMPNWNFLMSSSDIDVGVEESYVKNNKIKNGHFL